MVNVSAGPPETVVDRIVIGMKTMAECFKIARSEMVERKGGEKVMTVNINSVALRAKTPEKLETTSYKTTTMGDDLLITAR